MLSAIRKTIILVLCSLALSLFCTDYSSAQDNNSVMQYYWEMAKDNFKQKDIIGSGIKFSVLVESRRYDLGPRGKVTKRDSAEIRYFFHAGKVDSIQAVTGDLSRFDKLDISLNDIFDNERQIYEFPNDTGGVLLNIGIGVDSAALLPDGFITIDRRTFQLSDVCLYYPNVEGMRHLTRDVSFVEYEGYIFPDYFLDIVSLLGLFYTRDYRLETKVMEVIIDK